MQQELHAMVQILLVEYALQTQHNICVRPTPCTPLNICLHDENSQES